MDNRRMTCIICPIGCLMEVSVTDAGLRVTNNKCKKGVRYGASEIESPRRTLTTTVRATLNGKKITVPVRTAGEIPKALMRDAMRELNGIEIINPLPSGHALVNDLLGTGVAVVLTDAARVKE